MASVHAGPEPGAARTSAAKAKAKPAGTAGAAAGRRSVSATSAESRLAELKRRLQEASDIASASAVLGWDQATYMPKGGASARGRQSATLSRLAHERFIDSAVGKLLDGLTAYA
jgi:hypothetical protein